MQIKRLFTSSRAKGNENYLNTQKYYELARTILYFAISLALFFGGWIQTGNRNNLLTIVAILGCLPASKSAVSTIIYFRYKSCNAEDTKKIKTCCKNITNLYDCIFTSYKINFRVDHLVIRGNNVCGYTSDIKFADKEFLAHMEEHLRLDGHKNVSLKIFKDISKYTERLMQMEQLEDDIVKSEGIKQTFLSLML